MTILSDSMISWRETKALCYDKYQEDRMETLGISNKPEEVWLKIAFDTNHIVSVREDGEHSDRCLVYLKDGESFYIQESYSDVLDVIFHRA